MTENKEKDQQLWSTTGVDKKKEKLVVLKQM